MIGFRMLCLLHSDELVSSICASDSGRASRGIFATAMQRYGVLIVIVASLAAAVQVIPCCAKDLMLQLHVEHACETSLDGVSVDVQL